MPMSPLYVWLHAAGRLLALVCSIVLTCQTFLCDVQSRSPEIERYDLVNRLADTNHLESLQRKSISDLSVKKILNNNVRLISHPRKNTADNWRELPHGAFLNATHSAMWGDTVAPEPRRFNQAKQMICLSYSGAWQRNATAETSIIDGSSWLQFEGGQQNIYQHLVRFIWTA